MKRPSVVLATMAAAVAIVTLDTTILNVAIPTIRHDLHTTFTNLQWVIVGYSLTLGSLLIIGGRLGDLFGTRRAFVIGALLFATGSLVASLATTTPALIVGEAVIEGIGASLLFPASLATLSTTFEGAARAKAFAVWGGVAGASAALGPVIGGWLTSDYSWRWGFRINVVVAPLAALAARLALPADRPRTRSPRLDGRGAALLAAGLFLVVFAVTEGPDRGWLTLVVAFAAAGVALIAFVRHERTTAEPLIDLGLFRHRSFSGGLVTAATVVMAQAGAMFVLAIFLQATHRLTPVAAGRWLLPVGLAVLVGAQLGGRLAASGGPVRAVRTGIVVQLLGVLVAAAVVSTDIGWALLGGALAVFGIGAGMASSQLTSVVLASVPRTQAGAASGVATTNSSLGAAFGVAILGAVLRLGPLSTVASARGALFTAAGLLGLGAAASMLTSGSTSGSTSGFTSGAGGRPSSRHPVSASSR